MDFYKKVVNWQKYEFRAGAGTLISIVYNEQASWFLWELNNYPINLLMIKMKIVSTLSSSIITVYVHHFSVLDLRRCAYFVRTLIMQHYPQLPQIHIYHWKQTSIPQGRPLLYTRWFTRRCVSIFDGTPCLNRQRRTGSKSMTCPLLPHYFKNNAEIRSIRHNFLFYFLNRKQQRLCLQSISTAQKCCHL